MSLSVPYGYRAEGRPKASGAEAIAYGGFTVPLRARYELGEVGEEGVDGPLDVVTDEPPSPVHIIGKIEWCRILHGSRVLSLFFG